MLIATIFSSGIVIIVHTLQNPSKTEGAWFDDNWAYRKAITFTHNAAVSDTQVELDIDTTDAPDKFQSDCGDVRFTDPNGKLLRYYLDSAAGACDTASTDFDVLMPSIINGENFIYMYYGNPSIVNGTEAADFSQATTTPSGGAPSAGTEANAPSPVLYWKFDDASGTTSEDSSQNGLDGTQNNTPTIQTEDMCIAGKCLWFDGTNNENVSRADNPLLDFVAADNFTISAWVKRNGASSANNFIITKAQTGYTGYKLYQDASGDFCFDVSDGTNTDTACTTAVEFDDNQWHYVGGVKTGTTSITLYVDGKQRAQDASIVATGTLANTGTFYTGVDLDGTSNEWFGFIDEVKVYKEAKSAAQIQAEFTARGSRKGSATLGANTQNIEKVLSNGLVGYWKANESSGNMADSSGNVTTLTDTNTVAFVAGKFGNGGDFESTASEYQFAADNAALSITGSTTLTAWISPESVSAGSYNIIAKWDGANESYRLFQNGDEIRLELDSSGNYQETSAANLAASTWYHVVGVYNATTATATIYIDGAISTSTTTGTIPSSIGDDAGRFHIGAEDSTGGATGFYDGIIDEARVYNRVLTSAEVTQFYNWAPGPVGYWDFEEKQGTTANDRSSNSNTGTLTSGPTWTSGKVGSALNFDGSDDNVTIADSSILDLSVSGQYTWSAWINPSGTITDDCFWNQGSAAITQFCIEAITTADTDFGPVTNGITASWLSSWTTNGLIAHTTDNVIATGSWYFIEVTYDGTLPLQTNRLKIYVNGVDSTDTSDIRSVGTISNISPTSTTIGTNLVPEPYSGRIDEVKFYNYVRTRSQIIEDMNAGHPAPGSPIGSQVAYYKFDEGYGTTANNSVTTGGLSGTLTNGPVWTNSGKFGKAVHFDGSNDVVTVTNANAIDFDTNLASGSSFTAWVRPQDAGENSTGQIYEKGQGRRLRVLNPSGSNLDVEAFLDLETTDAVATISAGITTGVWNHIAVIWQDDVDDEIEIYINGLLRATSTGGSGRPTSGSLSDADNLSIGGNASNNWHGRIDEFKVYSSPLTADQIKIDYNRGASQVMGALSTDIGGQATNSAERSYCPPGDTTATCSPVGYWDFEEKSGVTAYSKGSSAADGQLEGTTKWTNGKIGGALSFSAAGDLVSLGTVNIPDNQNAWTIQAWVHFGTSVTQDEIIYCITGGANGPCVYTGVNSELIACGNTCVDTADSSNNALSPNIWQHIAVTKTTGTTFAFFVNGINVTDDSAGEESDASGLEKNIGGAGSSFFLSGMLDDLRIYNYQRSKAQIMWDYNYGKALLHLKMDECQGTTLNDSAGNLLSGSLYLEGTAAGTCATSGQWFNGVSGKYNYSFDFDGTNDVATVSADTKIDLNDGLAAEHSFSTWVYADSDGENDLGQIYYKGQGTLLRVSGQSGSNLTVEALYDLATTDATATVSAGITTGSWNHIAITWKDDSDDELSLYINGRLRATSADGSGAPAAEAENLLIGGVSTRNFDGKIDDFKVFNYELSAIQVRELYNQGTVRFGPSTGAP